ncbi:MULTISPECIES: hypothetical protein [Rahnella]|uniref:Uncharacterized protein n=1 Tax=Rahnella laticis TaxID=2787622 RepID=A0ABS0E109_9GAMM|nr:MULTISPECIES: hypothetical protein [Rahnella]MBF7978761.1 hypothetical protein [Rahnella laticis]MBF7998851.1 hypothetical protein [Rahnella sp. LAC-M12]
MLNEERVTYNTLKDWALESYFDYSRDLALKRGTTHEEIIGYVSYTFEDGFERLIENLMWQVILLVISGGWYPERNKVMRAEIINILSTNSLEDMLINVPSDERKLFLHDLKILEFI